MESRSRSKSRSTCPAAVSLGLTGARYVIDSTLWAPGAEKVPRSQSLALATTVDDPDLLLDLDLLAGRANRLTLFLGLD